MINAIASFLTDYILVVILLVAALWFTMRTGAVQVRMLGEMLRLLARSGGVDSPHANDSEHSEQLKHVSSFQAFSVSIASRVGVGNLAGVASAISIGGPGAVFWMWLIAILGSATAFIESTLAQLFKVKGDGCYRGGPAYYILKGIGKKWWAVLFAVLIAVTFGLAFNSVQSNTVSSAFATSFGISPTVSAMIMTALTLAIICGGIRGIARFSEVIVPVMAIGYILLAIVVIGMNITTIPSVLKQIVTDAFGLREATGGMVGAGIAIGIRRGLFSNEAGEGSAPNVAATATVSHPVKQGLIQSLSVLTDTLLICSCTAFIILCSGAWTGSHDGIALTQAALDSELGVSGLGATFIAIAIFFFALTSIVANYYYGETNLQFIHDKMWPVWIYRFIVGGIVFLGGIQPLDVVWQFADITMALMTLCNIAALFVLGKYAIICLRDYQAQKLRGYDPTYHRSTIPSIASHTDCWPD